MRSLSFILVSVLFASVGMAGQQDSAVLENPSYQFVNNRVMASGAVRGKMVRELARFMVKGNVNGENCDASATPCILRISVSGRKLTAVVNIDRANDGNPQTILRDAPVATIAADGQIQFAVNVTAKYVVERYSFVERALGQKNDQWIELTLKM